MFKGSNVVLAAVACFGAAAVSASRVSADDGNSTLTLEDKAPLYAQEAHGRRPLMALLDRAGAADTLEDARIDVYGRVEAGWTHNFSDPAGDLNLGRVFDIEHDDPTLNQIDLNIERLADLKKGEFDIGFRVEMLYGGDARFLHSNGLLDSDDFFSGPDNQFDLVQAYADFGVPVGNGLRIRAGKFLFFKQIDPNASVFYSHSYTFGAALPFTLTGVTGMYNFNDQWSLEVGTTRGWGQSLDDNNSALDYLAKVTYRPSDKTSMSLLAITGPELDDNNGDWRTVFDFVIRHELADDWTVLLDAIYGFQPNAPEADDPGATGDNTWYGIAGYLVHDLNEHVSVGARLEWFHDEGGFTTGVDQNLYEATLGVTLTPFAGEELGQNLKIRPEIRYDYSDEDFFDGLTSNSQFTAAVDVIYNF